MIVPLELKQSQGDAATFNIVLAKIAAISPWSAASES